QAGAVRKSMTGNPDAAARETTMQRLVIAALLVLGVPFMCTAQTITATTGAVNGTVTDTTKAVLPGVTVTLSGPGLMGTPTAVTDQSGSYRFSAVPPGDYTVACELAGFGPVKREGIHVGVGFTATVNIDMSPGTVTENVTVSG